MESGFMAEVRPFKGLFYDRSKIGGDYSSVVAPPYDVISDRMRDALYARNQYNVIRLILGKASEGDNEKDNTYTRAAATINKWMDDGVLVRDKNENFYVYLQEYPYRGKKFSRLGFIGLMKIEDSERNKIYPHEKTLAKPKADRMNLISKVGANLSPIFSLFSTPGKGSARGLLEKTITGKEPVIDVSENGERERLWKIDDPGALDSIVDMMKEARVFIADGHHRYEVARQYRDMMRRESGYDGSADHVMMYFADMSDVENLTVMATHRVVKKMPFRGDEDAKRLLSGHFSSRVCSSVESLIECLDAAEENEQVFGYFGGNEYLLFSTGEVQALTSAMPEARRMEWKTLDVSILHSAVFKTFLSVDDGEGNITYVRDAGKAAHLVSDGSHEAAFFLRATRVSQIKAVAELGEMMPQKSTYFYPKLLSGLVINKFR